jgi:hypothetical protein
VVTADLDVTLLGQVLDVLSFTDDERLTICHAAPDIEFTLAHVTASTADAEVDRWRDRANVWFSINAVRVPPGYTGRGAVKHVTRWTSIYADLDVKEGGLPSEDAAHDVIELLSQLLGHAPVAVIYSGHGLQPAWALDPDDNAVHLAGNPACLTEARALMRRFGRLVAHVAEHLIPEPHRGNVDTVYDLARVLRVPGTVNMKVPDAPVATGVDLPGGSPLTVQELTDALDAYGIKEIPGDRDAHDEIISDPHEWGWATTTCTYTTATIEGWKTDPPKKKGRHPQMVGMSVRLAAMHRHGCLTEVDHQRGVRIIREWMTRVCTEGIGGEKRELVPGEIADAIVWGRDEVATKTDEALVKEFGKHTHGTGEAADPPPALDLTPLWERESLARLRDFARARRVGPLAVLGAALARVIAACPSNYVLPPIVGGVGSLNIAINLVGPSGLGKGTAHTAAGGAIDLSGFRDTVSGDSKLLTWGLGSGEGIAHIYAVYEKKKDEPGGLKRVRDSVLFLCLEIDTMTALGNRQSATLLPKIREAWSGEEISFGYADTAKRLKIEEQSYRFCLISGVQPERAAGLLADVSGGMPQRMVWLPTDAPDVSDTRSKAPARWPVKVPPDPRQQTEIRVCPEAEAVIDSVRVIALRTGKAPTGALDAHALYAREKVAAGLAILDGHLVADGITSDDWALAGLIMKVSDRARASVEATLAEEQKRSNDARASAEATRAVTITNAVETSMIQKASRAALRVLSQRPAGEWMARSKLSKLLDSPLRAHLGQALEALELAGEIESQEINYHGQSGHQYRVRS